MFGIILFGVDLFGGRLIQFGLLMPRYMGLGSLLVGWMSIARVSNKSLYCDMV